MVVPRLRGRVAEIELPIEDKGKFCYELSLWTFDGETQVGEPWLFGPFASEAVAMEKGKEIVKFAAEAIEKDMTGEVSGKFFDLKNGGILRPWAEQ